MSKGETMIFIASLLAAVVLCASWMYQYTRIGTRVCRPSWTMPLITALICAGLLFAILKRWASSDVRDSSKYLVFYMGVGAAWIGVAMCCTGMAGISVRDDVVERRNGAASMALAGAILGL